MLLASTVAKQSPGCPQQFTLTVPKIEAYFTGTGDLLAALILARMADEPTNLAFAVEKAVASLQNVLVDTAAHAGDAVHASKRTPTVYFKRELRLIQNWKYLLDPVVTVLVEPVSV